MNVLRRLLQVEVSVACLRSMIDKNSPNPSSCCCLGRKVCIGDLAIHSIRNGATDLWLWPNKQCKPSQQICVAKAKGCYLMKHRAFISSLAESVCKCITSDTSAKELFQYYKRQGIWFMLCIFIFLWYNRYMSIKKQGKKMKYATRANGRRATHEQRKQKDLTELPPHFTQIFSFQY